MKKTTITKWPSLFVSEQSWKSKYDNKNRT
jgi:hypothetical protein